MAPGPPRPPTHGPLEAALIRVTDAPPTPGPAAPLPTPSLTVVDNLPDPCWRGLTGPELVLAHLIASGATNGEAAQQLSLSPHTVNTRLLSVFAKLGVHSRGRLAHLYAREVGSAGSSA